MPNDLIKKKRNIQHTSLQSRSVSPTCTDFFPVTLTFKQRLLPKVSILHATTLFQGTALSCGIVCLCLPLSIPHTPKKKINQFRRSARTKICVPLSSTTAYLKTTPGQWSHLRTYPRFFLAGTKSLAFFWANPSQPSSIKKILNH